jgi:hypothetical protein
VREVCTEDEASDCASGARHVSQILKLITSLVECFGTHFWRLVTFLCVASTISSRLSLTYRSYNLVNYDLDFWSCAHPGQGECSAPAVCGRERHSTGVLKGRVLEDPAPRDLKVAAQVEEASLNFLTSERRQATVGKLKVTALSKRSWEWLHRHSRPPKREASRAPCT